MNARAEFMSCDECEMRGACKAVRICAKGRPAIAVRDALVLAQSHIAELTEQRDELLAVVERVACLNRSNAEIGAGMLAQLVDQARAAIVRPVAQHMGGL